MIFNFSSKKLLIEAEGEYKVIQGNEWRSYNDAQKTNFVKSRIDNLDYKNTNKWLYDLLNKNVKEGQKVLPIIENLVKDINYRKIEGNVLALLTYIINNNQPIGEAEEYYLSNKSLYDRNRNDCFYIANILRALTSPSEIKKYFNEECSWIITTTTPNEADAVINELQYREFANAGLSEKDNYTIPRIDPDDKNRSVESFPWNKYDADTIYRRLEIWTALHGKDVKVDKKYSEKDNSSNTRPEEKAERVTNYIKRLGNDEREIKELIKTAAKEFGLEVK